MSKFRSNKEWLNNLFFEHSALQAVVVMAIIIAVGLGFGVILVGTLMALLFSKLGHIPMGDMVGILCGATTNTPALGAAQQTLVQLGEPTSGAALSCAITYPLGVVGVILAMLLVRKLFVR